MNETRLYFEKNYQSNKNTMTMMVNNKSDKNLYM